MVCALEREIDEAGNLLPLLYRNLPCDERRDAHRLKCRQEVADAAAGLIDPIDEDEVRNPKLVEQAQRWRGERRAGWIGIDHDNRGVRKRQGAGAISRKAHGPRAVDEREVVAEIIEVHQVELG